MIIDLQKASEEENLYNCNIGGEVEPADIEELIALIKLRAKNKKETKINFKLDILSN